MLHATRRRPPQRLAALVALLLALLMQALWMPRLAVAHAAGVEVCSAQGHRRIPLPSEDGHSTQQHGHDCCCPAAWLGPPPTEPASTVPGAPRPVLPAMVPQLVAAASPAQLPPPRGPPASLP